MIMKNLKKTIVLSLFAPLLFSCSTLRREAFSPTEEGNWSSVQTVAVFQDRASQYENTKKAIPLSAVIQPEELVTSPVLDIASLKFLETETGNVESSTVLQEKRKKEIENAIRNGEKDIDVSLPEDYGQATSGSLAEEATTSSFSHITHKSSYANSIAEYDYIPGLIYEIITSPKGITDFRLQPGEQIAGTPISNENSVWQFSMGTSLENGETVQHLFIRPLRTGLDTSLIILTNMRTYYFRMASFESQYMTALRFRYPNQSTNGTFLKEDFESFIEEQQNNIIHTLDVTTANYNYKIKVTDGKPSWKPVTVFSNSNKTYIQFPVSVQNTDDLPSVYLYKQGKENLVNYRIFGNIYMIDTVLDDASQSFFLKSGQREKVKITRTK